MKLPCTLYGSHRCVGSTKYAVHFIRRSNKIFSPKLLFWEYSILMKNITCFLKNCKGGLWSTHHFNSLIYLLKYYMFSNLNLELYFLSMIFLGKKTYFISYIFGVFSFWFLCSITFHLILDVLDTCYIWWEYFKKKRVRN